MTSSRLPPDLTVNATTRTLAALRRRGIDVVDLTESNPTRVGFDYPDDLLAPLGSAEGLVYAPQPLGMTSARNAVAGEFVRRGFAVSADAIALTASTSEAYALLFKLLCDPGDQVLVPRPSYPLFEHLTVLESIEARPYRLEYHGTWRIDVDDLRAGVTDRTRAVLVVSPNNPTGSFLHADDLDEVAGICAARNAMLIGDEVFADFPLEAAPRRASVLDAEGVLACSLGGLSKSVGLPQLKLGWIAFKGDPPRLAETLAAYEVMSDTYLSVGTPVQVALPSLLARGARIREQIHARTRRNLAALRRAASSTPSVSVLTCEGGWSAVLQVPAIQSEEALVLTLLTEDHVLAHPGFFFDMEREAFLVVSLIVEPDTFDRGVGRLLARASHARAHQ
jgi:aspartate/methionine/tyrosine aminotransferase